MDEMEKKCLHIFLLDSDLGDLSEGGMKLWREKGESYQKRRLSSSEEREWG